MTNLPARCFQARCFQIGGLFSILLCFVLPWASIAVAADGTAAAETSEQEKVDFSADVRPILSDHCFACHGPDANERHGGLRLDLAETAFAAADSGHPVIVAGDVAGSLLVSRIDSGDEYEVMPPPESHKPLSDVQKDVLRRWIAEGAEYSAHWSLVSPKHHDPPKVKHEDFVRDEIDRFILRSIERVGLEPNREADRESLIRRVTFDLTGLPPTVDEVQDFVLDASPDAYEKVVDRLLDSPRFGEHVGRYWLDLVRYGDTHGLHLDNYREMWPYRDWVIHSFNDNKPFKQFITEQLAGDLMPGDDLERLIASGFNRLNVTTNEGGSIYDEVFARNVIDRTDAFGTVFLGLTTGCAVCHDHKFDPISQRDFFSLSAFFNSLDGQAMDGNIKDHPPVARVPTEDHLRQLNEVKQMRAGLEEQMNGPLPEVDTAEAGWIETIAGAGVTTQKWIHLQPSLAASSVAGSTMQIGEDGSVLAGGEIPAKEIVTIEAPLPKGGAYQLVRLGVLPDSPDQGAGRSDNGNAVLSELEVAVKSEATGGEYLPVKLVYAEADHWQTDGAKFSIDFAIDGKVEGDAGWAIGGHQQPGPRNAWFVAGSLLDASEGEASIRVVLKYESQYAGHSFKQVRISVSEDLPQVSKDRLLAVGPWNMVGPFEIESHEPGYYQEFASQGKAFDADETFTYREGTFGWQKLEDYKPAVINALPTIKDRSSVMLLHRKINSPAVQKVTLLLGTEDGYQIFLGGQKVAELKENRPITPLADEITLNLQAGDNDLYLKVITHDGLASFATAIRSPAAPVPAAIVQFAQLNASDRSEKEIAALRNYYRRVVSIHPAWLVLRDMAVGLRKRADEIRNSMPTTLVWKELDAPRTAHILMRGEYDKPGDAVERAVPESLTSFPEDAPRDRLGLAKWLVSEDHPLTARVAVNRFWQQLFGTGIVKTSEDFGAQGSPPSHPELLDTLAIDFRNTGWDVKQLMKRLVMTSTYRRDTLVTDKHLQVDPGNRLLARGPRFRLDAEMIRDAALATSGLLVEQLGGPSVKPPQPGGLWRAVGYTSSNTAAFKADEGEKVYRRSVYTFWKRTSAPPQMSTFDAPSRESCTARRERTNTPLQALLLLNEPQMLEASRALADRAEVELGANEAERIRWMYVTVVSRQPTDSELTELMSLREDLERYYSAAPEAMKQLGAASAAAAAESLVASTILNLDQALNK